MPGQGHSSKERKIELEKWVMQATKPSLLTRLKKKNGSLRGPPTPDNGSQVPTRSHYRGLKADPVSRPGKRKRGSARLNNEQVRKKPHTTSAPTVGPSTQSTTSRWERECFVNKWLENTAHAPSETSSSTDAESLMGDDIDRLDLQYVPGKDFNSDGEEVPRVPCEFSWSKAFRHQKRPTRQQPSLKDYQAALKQIASETLRENKQKEEPNLRCPTNNAFTGSFQKYLSDSVSPSTPQVRQKISQRTAFECHPVIVNTKSKKTGADSSALSKSFNDINNLLDKFVGDDVLEIECPQNPDCSHDWVQG